MKKTVSGIIILLLFSSAISAQLVTKRDYSAAIAIQAGGAVNLFLPDRLSDINIQPTAGLKMTFPFNREWFMGAEINYNVLRLTNNNIYFPGDQPEDSEPLKLKIHQVQVPLYVKRMLRSNRASLLFGGYFAWNYDHKFTGPKEGSVLYEGDEPEKWEAGLLIGFEQNLAKGLDLTVKVCGGLKNLHKNGETDQKSYPVQANLTLSYRLLRLGGCKCD